MLTVLKNFKHLFQIPSTFFGAIAAFGSTSCGFLAGYPSTAIHPPNDYQYSFPVTLQEQYWIQNTCYIGKIIGSLMTGPMMDTLGRKPGMMLNALLVILGCVMAFLSSNIFTYCIAAIILTSTIPLISGITLVYNAEVGLPQNRGLLVSFCQVFNNLGIFLRSVIIACMPRIWLIISCCSTVILWSIMITFLPESPHWLLAHNNKEDAESSFKSLRGKKRDSSTKIPDIQQETDDKFKSTCWIEYIRPPLVKNVLICSTLSALQASCGAIIIENYTMNILQSTFNNVNPYFHSVILGLVMLLSAAFSCIIVDRFERHTLLILSGCLMSVGMLILGLYFNLKEHKTLIQLQKSQYIPLTALAIYTVGFSFGFSYVPFIILVELFPTEFRARATTIYMVVSWIFTMVNEILFLDTKDIIGYYHIFLIYSGVSFLGLLFSGCFIMNTRDKPNETLHLDILHAFSDKDTTLL